MAITTSLRRVGPIAAVLVLLAGCAERGAAQGRFEAECKAAGHAAGSKAFAACVERQWARYRYVPKTKGR